MSIKATSTYHDVLLIFFVANVEANKNNNNKVYFLADDGNNVCTLKASGRI